MTSCCVCNGPMHQDCPRLDLNPVGDFVRDICVRCAERVIQVAFETWGWKRTVSLAPSHVQREEFFLLCDAIRDEVETRLKKAQKTAVTILPTDKTAETSTSTPARIYTNDNAEDSPPPMLE